MDVRSPKTFLYVVAVVAPADTTFVRWNIVKSVTAIIAIHLHTSLLRPVAPDCATLLHLTQSDAL